MEQIKRGKKIIIAVIIACLALSFAVTALSSTMSYSNGNIDEATYELVQGGFRFILECILFLFLYKGHNWARILILILFGIGGLGAIITVFTNSIIMLFMVVPYTLSFILLLNKSVVAYQRYARNKDTKTD